MGYWAVSTKIKSGRRNLDNDVDSRNRGTKWITTLSGLCATHQCKVGATFNRKRSSSHTQWDCKEEKKQQSQHRVPSIPQTGWRTGTAQPMKIKRGRPSWKRAATGIPNKTAERLAEHQAAISATTSNDSVQATHPQAQTWKREKLWSAKACRSLWTSTYACIADVANRCKLQLHGEGRGLATPYKAKYWKRRNLPNRAFAVGSNTEHMVSSCSGDL